MILLRLIFAGFILLSATGFAQGETGLTTSKTPIHVEADKMVSKQTDKSVVFSGRVRAKQGDLLINCQELTIFHHESGPKAEETAGASNAGPEIERLIAVGNVEIVQEGMVATGDKFEYSANDEKAILTGNAKILQENNLVTGHRVFMNMASGETEVVPEDGDRVTGYFYPSAHEEKTSSEQEESK